MENEKIQIPTENTSQISNLSDGAEEPVPMQEAKRVPGFTIVVFVVFVAVIGALAFLYFRNNTDLTNSSHPTRQPTATATQSTTPTGIASPVTKYELFTDSQIQFGVPVPVYPEATLEQKYAGINGLGQDVIRVKYYVPSTVEVDTTTDYFRVELQGSGWEITNINNDLCYGQKVDLVCAKWRELNAKKGTDQLLFSTVFGSYFLELTRKVEQLIVLGLPEQFPEQLVPYDFKPTLGLAFKDSVAGIGVFVIEPSSSISLSVQEHFALIKNVGFTEQCGLSSSPRIISYGCSRGQEKIFVERTNEEYYPSFFTSVRYEFPL